MGITYTQSKKDTKQRRSEGKQNSVKLLSVRLSVAHDVTRKCFLLLGHITRGEGGEEHLVEMRWGERTTRTTRLECIVHGCIYVGST